MLRDSAPTGAMPFEEAQKTFLYPHKLGPAQRERTRALPASAGWTGVGVGRFGSRDLQRYPPVPEEDVLAELRAELRLHTKEIVALQADFVRLFPFDKLTRLKADELKIALAERVPSFGSRAQTSGLGNPHAAATRAAPSTPASSWAWRTFSRCSTSAERSGPSGWPTCVPLVPAVG